MKLRMPIIGIALLLATTASGIAGDAAVSGRATSAATQLAFNYTPVPRTMAVPVAQACDSRTEITCQAGNQTWCCPKNNRCITRENDSTGGGVSGACMR